MWKPPERVRHKLPDPAWPTAPEASTARLYQPLTLRSGLVLRERTWVPAMVPWRATEGGDVTPEVLRWYGRFAEGAPAAVVVEATGVRDVPSGPLLRIGHDRFVSGLRALTDTVRERSHGRTRVFIQLIDFLRIRRRPEPGVYFRRFFALDAGHRARLAAHTGDRSWLGADEGCVREALAAMAELALSEVLTARELEDLTQGARERITDTALGHIASLPEELPRLFAEAARRAQAAGFDGVELHCAHAYTLSSFLSALNTRTDGYGGAREARVRLPLEVYSAVRAQVGDGFTVGARFLCDDVVAGGSRVDDAAYFGLRFAEAGMDFLSLSTGGRFEDAARPKVGEAAYPYTGRSGFECMPTVIADARGPFGRNVAKQAMVRRALRDNGFETPVVVAGGIGTFALAEGILARGEADVIASARQSLADPDWFLKVREGCGAEVRRCTYSNYCEALDQHHERVTCQLWDRTELDGDDVVETRRGARRLVAPPWTALPGGHEDG